MSTWDVPTVTSLKLSAKCPETLRLTVDAVAIPLYATEAVRDLNVNRRKCRFYDESNLKISSSYSVNLCHSQCRVDFAVKKCGCAPFFYEGVVEGIYVVNTKKYHVFAPMGRFQLESAGTTVENKGKLILFMLCIVI